MKTTDEIAKLLYGENPYVGISVQPQLTCRPIVKTEFLELIRYKQPKRILEVGTWMGASAIHMAKCAKAVGLRDFNVLCVDTWLGSPEHWRPDFQHPVWGRQRLKLKNGRPSFYQEFLENVVTSGNHDAIVPFSQTSENAYQIFKMLGLQFDMIYVDAAHDEASALRDLENYHELLAPDGILFGDDYPLWEGVRVAVHKFADAKNLDVYGKSETFILSDDDNLQELLKPHKFVKGRSESYEAYEKALAYALKKQNQFEAEQWLKILEFWHPNKTRDNHLRAQVLDWFSSSQDTEESTLPTVK